MLIQLRMYNGISGDSDATRYGEVGRDVLRAV